MASRQVLQQDGVGCRSLHQSVSSNSSRLPGCRCTGEGCRPHGFCAGLGKCGHSFIDRCWHYRRNSGTSSAGTGDTGLRRVRATGRRRSSGSARYDTSGRRCATSVGRTECLVDSQPCRHEQGAFVTTVRRAWGGCLRRSSFPRFCKNAVCGLGSGFRRLRRASRHRTVANHATWQLASFAVWRRLQWLELRSPRRCNPGQSHRHSSLDYPGGRRSSGRAGIRSRPPRSTDWVKANEIGRLDQDGAALIGIAEPHFSKIVYMSHSSPRLLWTMPSPQ